MRPNKYKSQLEATLAKFLEDRGVPFAYEHLQLSYTQTRKYVPDFELPNGIIIEAKGKFTSEDRRKHLSIKKEYPHLDIRFVFQRDNKLRKNSQMKYSEWADRHGYIYAIGSIPEQWLTETS